MMDEVRTTQPANRELVRRGALIMSVFALIWASAGAWGVADANLALAVQIAALAITAGIVALAWRGVPVRIDRPRQLPDDWMRRFNLVGIAQGAAIGLTVLVLAVSGNPALIPAVVCLIVGIHFFPLAGIFDQPEYRWTGAALCGVALLGVATLASSDAEASRAAVGLGAAGTLWATALSITRIG